jgi:AcrR family transcriptional regulator
MAGKDTKGKILDAAEQLFAEMGFHGVSLRMVAEAGGVSISLVQYHFATKEQLYESVFERRIVTINNDRLRKLDQVEVESRRLKQRVDLEGVLEAFVSPTVLLARDKEAGGAVYAQLLAQLTNDPQPHARKVSRKYTDPIARQTMRVLHEALPEMDDSVLPWCYVFAVGAMIASISTTGRVGLLSEGKCDPDDVQKIVALLVPFLAGGFERVAELTAHAGQPESEPAQALKPRRKAPVTGGRKGVRSQDKN